MIMAQGSTLAINNEAAAQQWLAQCRSNNAQLNELLVQLGSLLQAVGDSSEGDIVDSFVNYSTRVAKEATSLFEGITQIAQSVSDLIGIGKDLVSGIIGGIARIATGG